MRRRPCDCGCMWTNSCKRPKEETKMKNTDELKQSKEDLKIGFSWEPKTREISPIGKVIRFKSNVNKGKLLTGYCVGVDDTGCYNVYYSDTSIGNPIKIFKERIVEAYEVVKHEPKKLVPTKPYAQLVAYDYFEDGSRKWGVFTHVEGETVFAYWGEHYPTWMPLDRIVAVEDIIIHEPKEQNLSAAQELSVQQESANFAHAAVQGIINAHAEKNNAKEINVQIMLPRFYSQEEYKKYGQECYLQGQEDTEKRMISQNTLDLAKEKAYSEGLNDAKRVAFTFDDFDLSVNRTWKKQDFKDAVSNAALGLTGEAGEVADLIKKGVYHGRGLTPEYAIPDNGEIDLDDVKDELSDVLFYVSAMAQEFGFTLEDVAKHNREKLEKRFPEGFSTEASAQKKDRAPEVKPKGVINIKKRSLDYPTTKEDHLEVILEDDLERCWYTFFKTSKNVDKKIDVLRERESVTIRDEHECTITFTKVNGLINILSWKDDNTLDFKGEGFSLKVNPKEVTN